MVFRFRGTGVLETETTTGVGAPLLDEGDTCCSTVANIYDIRFVSYLIPTLRVIDYTPTHSM